MTFCAEKVVKKKELASVTECLRFEDILPYPKIKKREDVQV